MSLVDRGDILDADLPHVGPHPVLVVTRQVAIPVLADVTVAVVTSTIRGHAAEVPLGPQQGLDHECVANCDDLLSIPKRILLRRRGSLPAEGLDRLDAALRFALGLD